MILRKKLADYGVPLATGENEFAYHGFRELIRAGAVDIVQADVCRAGGITEVMKIGRLAAKHGVRLAPHTWSDPVAVVANAHVVAASPNGVTCEVDQTGNRFIEDLVGPLPIAGGLLDLGDRPGPGDRPGRRRGARASAGGSQPHSRRQLLRRHLRPRGQTRYIGDYVPKAAGR